MLFASPPAHRTVLALAEVSEMCKYYCSQWESSERVSSRTWDIPEHTSVGCASHSCPALGWSARLDAVRLRRRTTFKQTKTNYLNYESGICWEIRVSCLFICCDCCLLQTKEVRRAPSLLHAQCVTAVHYFTFCKECFDGLESHIQTTARKGEARCRAFSSSNS